MRGCRACKEQAVPFGWAEFIGQRGRKVAVHPLKLARRAHVSPHTMELLISLGTNTAINHGGILIWRSSCEANRFKKSPNLIRSTCTVCSLHLSISILPPARRDYLPNGRRAHGSCIALFG